MKFVLFVFNRTIVGYKDEDMTAGEPPSAPKHVTLLVHKLKTR